MADAPIQNIDANDIVGVRKDGGVDLVIVASSRLDGSPETQQLVLDKLESYLQQLNSSEFQKEFGPSASGKVSIVLNCDDEPDPTIRELLRRAEPWTTANNARLELRVGPIA
jgi:hypothetical protein